MTFNFRKKADSHQMKSLPNGLQECDSELPKLTNAQLTKSIKDYPAWLKDGSESPKQLPGIYLGVLGQVQLQPELKNVGGIMSKISTKQQLAYMNRFTDTERVHQLLSASRLPDETLATIWAYVNKTFPGRLTNREVCLALALIAIFQKLENETGATFKGSNRDPFSLVKSKKKPPVPKLYPVSCEHKLGHSITESRSNSDNLRSSEILLVDIRDETDSEHETKVEPIATSQSYSSGFSGSNYNISKTKDLLDIKIPSKRRYQNQQHYIIDDGIYSSNFCLTDEDNLKYRLHQQIEVWLKSLCAIKTTFKRSYDILMVENARQSSLEALRSEKGQVFIKYLSLCYPLAHNIKLKLDYLNSICLISEESKELCNTSLFCPNIIEQFNDLITSLNEYWAVLINLFHDSGQTKYIEFIMDNLDHASKRKGTSKTIIELSKELNSFDKSETCSICHSNIYLSNCTTAQLMTYLPLDDAELLSSANEFISDDTKYSYHAKCANFWLNQIDTTQLPYTSVSSPIKLSSPPIPSDSTSLEMGTSMKNMPWFGLDIGGSLVKVVFFDPIEALPGEETALNRIRLYLKSSKAYGDAGRRDEHLEMSNCTINKRKGTLHFIRFMTNQMPAFIKLVKDKGLAESIDKICATGGGAYKFELEFKLSLSLALKKSDELDSVIYGIHYIEKHNKSNECYYIKDPLDEANSEKVPYDFGEPYPYLVVNIGSGVSILAVYSPTSYNRIWGSSIGGGTFEGLCCSLTQRQITFEEAIKMAEAGVSKKVDKLVKDIYGGDYTKFSLSGDTVASSFGNMNNSDYRSRAKPEDFARGVLELVTLNIASIARLCASLEKIDRVLFIGNFLRVNELSMKLLSYALNYWSKGEMKALFLQHEGYFGAVGCLVESTQGIDSIEW